MNCIDCGRPMRKRGEDLENHPGTVVHAAKGLCNPDHYLRRKAGTLDEIPSKPNGRRTHAEAVEGMPADEAERTRHNTDALVAYIRGRRERGWPDDGTLRRVDGLKEWSFDANPS